MTAIEEAIQAAKSKIAAWLDSSGSGEDLQDSLQIQRDWSVPSEDEPGLCRWLVSSRTGFFPEVGIPFVGAAVVGVVVELRRTTIDFQVELSNWSATLAGVRLGIWLDPALGLSRVAPESTAAEAATTAFSAPAAKHQPVIWGAATLSLNDKLDVGFLNGSLSMPPVALGDTGMILSAQTIVPHLFVASLPAEFASVAASGSFVGLFVKAVNLRLPPSLTLAGLDTLTAPIAAIGTTGFTGTFAAKASDLLPAGTPPTFDPATGTYTCKGAGKILGFAAAVGSISLAFRENALTASEIDAVLHLPGFDKDVDATAFLSVSGDLTVTVKNLGTLGPLNLAAIAEFTAESITLSNGGDGPAYLSVAGKLTPTIAVDGLDWPTLDIRALRIDTAGNLSFDGGWLDLPKAFCLDVFGFQLEITKIAFGADSPTRKWFGLSGGLKLIDGMPAGVSAEGLRVSWSIDPATGKPGDFGFSFAGIGVEFSIPNVLKFKGAIAMKTDAAKPADKRFEGAIALDLLALGVTVAATVVFGKQSGQTYMGIYLAAEIPSAIQLFSTGLGIYGIDALACLHMRPDKKPTEAWYNVEKTGWFHKTPVGVAGIVEKWQPAAGHFAFGAGITLGTVDDNGRKFNGKFLLLVLLPGPVILLQGQANLMRERSKLKDDPQFRALAALDFPAGTATFGLDAKYAYPDDGGIVRVAGSTEAYFNLNDANDWHVWVGKDKPMTARIQAELLGLCTAKAYLMLDSKSGVRLGCWAGLQKSWDFSVAKLDLEAWLDGNVAVSVMPPQFHGDLTMQATARVAVFGVKIGLSVHSKLTAEACDPFVVTGDLKVAVDLPWPLDDWSTTASLKWTKPKALANGESADADPQWPQLPEALQGVAMGHPLCAGTWPLSRQSGALLPNDANEQGFWVSVAGANENAAPTPELWAAAPVVPSDGRLELSFARPIGDATYLGGEKAFTAPVATVIGDPKANAGPASLALQLTGAALEWWDGSAWTAAQDENQPALAGAWVPGEVAQKGGGAGQDKLWLQGSSPWAWSAPLLAGKPGVPGKWQVSAKSTDSTTKKGDGGPGGSGAKSQQDTNSDGTGKGSGQTGAGGGPPGAQWVPFAGPGGQLPTPDTASSPAPANAKGESGGTGSAGGSSGGGGGSGSGGSGTSDSAGADDTDGAQTAWQSLAFASGVTVSWPSSAGGPSSGGGGLYFDKRSPKTGQVEVWLNLPRGDNGGVTLYVQGQVAVAAWDKWGVLVAQFAWSGAKLAVPIAKPNLYWVRLRSSQPFTVLGVAIWPV